MARKNSVQQFTINIFADITQSKRPTYLCRRKHKIEQNNILTRKSQDYNISEISS